MTNPPSPVTPPSPPKVDVPIVVTSVTRGGVTLSTGAFITMIAIAIMLAGAAYIWASVGKTDALKEYTQKFKDYESRIVLPALKSVDSLQSIADSAKRVVDHTTTIAARQAEHIKLLDDSAKALDAHNKELNSRLTNLADTTNVRHLLTGLETQVDVQKYEIDSLKTNTDTLKTTIRGLRVEVSTYKISGDSLKQIIINWPKPPAAKKVFGFLPQLTAKQAAIGSAILGVIVGYKVHR